MSKQKQIKMLLVDDDVDFLMQTKIRLEADGFLITTAESQKDAEELLKTYRPDIALLDLMMENMDAGFTLAFHIKQIDTSIPVIIASGVANETGIEFDAATKEERSWIKADVFLAKPVRYEQLKNEIDRLLEK